MEQTLKSEIRYLIAETKEKDIDLNVSQGKYFTAFIIRLTPLFLYNYRGALSLVNSIFIGLTKRYEAVRAEKGATANRINNWNNLLTGLLFGEKHLSEAGFVTEPERVVATCSGSKSDSATVPVGEDFKQQVQFQEDLYITGKVRIKTSNSDISKQSLAEPSPLPKVQTIETVNKHAFATYQIASALVYVITGVQIGEFFLYRSILTNAYKLTEKHTISLPLIPPFEVYEASFLAIFISLFSLAVGMLFRFLKPAWLINDISKLLRVFIIGTLSAAALAILFNAAVFYHENKMLRLTQRLDELTRPKSMSYSYATEIPEEVKQKHMEEIVELQDQLKPSIIIEVIRYVAISISGLCVVILSGLAVTVLLLTKYKNDLMKKHQQGVSRLLHLQAEERSQYDNFNTIKGLISALEINISKIAVMKNINSQNRQKNSWGNMLLLLCFALSLSACNEVATTVAPPTNDTTSVVVLRDISRSNANDSSAEKTEEGIVRQYLAKYVADSGVTFLSYAYIHEQTDVAQNLRTVVLDLTAGESHDAEKLSHREQLLESRRLTDRRFQEKQGFISYVADLVYKEPCTHSGTWLLESVFHLANACKAGSNAHVLVLTDGIQQSPMRSFSNPPSSFAEAEKLAKYDASVLKTKYSITSDTALKPVEEILILPPMNIDKNPAKGLSPSILRYYEALFVKGFGARGIKVYSGQI